MQTRQAVDENFAAKVIKLAQGGVDESVMLAYVDKAPSRFDLKAAGASVRPNKG